MTPGPVKTRQPPLDLQQLRALLARRDHTGFLNGLIAIRQQGVASKDNDFLRALGGDGLYLLLASPAPPSNAHVLAECYAELLLSKAIVAPRETVARLAALLSSEPLVKLAETIGQQQERPNAQYIEQVGSNMRTTCLHVRRIVQVMHMVMGDGRYSDTGRVRRSVFRSHQEQTFHRALSLRFPGLIALPNYPLDQIVDLDRIEDVDQATFRYGRLCRLDAVLVVPDEGDPVAAFELDSRAHDQKNRARADAMKNTLIAASGLPFFRLRVDSPESMSVDEWYALLSDEVVPHFELGNRIRSRQAAYSLIPCKSLI